ncbi:MAG TPA: PDDEXK nuclease domain-containing protein [bacterium]|nr:PDDEXK nuclease domain-containing protein [bacterium]
MKNSLDDYHQWIASLKARLRSVQIKAAIAVQTELLQFYWDLGSEIVERQKSSTWGDGFLKQLSQDLMAEFPDMKGFSRRNLELVRQWYVFWTGSEPITKQLVSQLCSIPWGHNLAIISKAKTPDEALYYVKNTLEYGWSRNVLVHQIESGLYQREGKAITNFKTTLPVPQSDLAQQVLKDPYVIDFLALTKEHTERELENGLVQHVTKFLLELGSGFAYMGRQVPVFVGEREFFLDLLFYHARLHCYLVIELKVGDFEPAHAGQLNFYVKAVDEQLRKEGDQPTIGLLLCKSKDKLVAEYALSDIAKPLGISEYQLTRSLPESFKSSLPSIEDIEAEIGSLA